MREGPESVEGTVRGEHVEPPPGFVISPPPWECRAAAAPAEPQRNGGTEVGRGLPSTPNLVSSMAGPVGRLAFRCVVSVAPEKKKLPSSSDFF